ncbi:FecCD family ABC transporter permease [Streptomyces candidus]|uniref:Iron complex transport system permease protein n=1 Tax=Streptomyces candidus TaxID=67283 RepID=A0A7X0HF00_9ACTN|nr:iron ABC transporter permease [Streptomyces candidus]MBB6435244.1 iron complex transport system permease protein [Streptomyces candidus]GHH40309.1 iron ABC transporter [Streptomyces candidus]
MLKPSVEPTARRSREPSSVPGRKAVRVGPVSGVWRARDVFVPLAAALALFAAVVVNTGRGDFPISVPEVVDVLFGGGDSASRMVVLEFRMPRSVVGALVGAALGLAGAIVQGISRNPLASPDILGITAGAGTGAVAVIVLGGEYGSVSGPLAEIGVPAASVLGGLLAAVLVYALAVRRGLSGYRVLLVGVGVQAVLSSLISWLLVKASIVDAGRAILWLTGSLNASTWDNARAVGWALLVLLPVALVLSFPFGALNFDDDTARGLGVRIDAARAALLVTAVLLTATATSAAGPVAFVALACPQLAVRLLRTGTPPLLASALLGAAVTVWADVLGRTAFGSIELPVGILTAAVGAPYLLYLLARSGKARRT